VQKKQLTTSGMIPVYLMSFGKDLFTSCFYSNLTQISVNATTGNILKGLSFLSDPLL